MASYDEVIARWRDRELGRTTRANLTNERMPAYDREIQSYGSHFPLARSLKDRKGEHRLWLLNGDRWPGSVTTRQQAAVRSALPFGRVIVPFSVLDEAGIVRDSVHVVDQTEDRIETWTDTYDEVPQSATWEYEEETLPGTAQWEVDGVLTGETRSWAKPEVEGLEEPLSVRFKGWDEYRLAMRAYHDELERRVKWVHRVAKNTGRKRLVNQDRHWDAYEIFEDTDGEVRYSIRRSRHWLGESLIRAQVRYYSNRTHTHQTRWAYFLSGFDHNERQPSYFFCELPKNVRPTTMAEAYDALKPDAVKYAESIGRDVLRQGDIFAIPTTVTTRELKKIGTYHKRQVEVYRANNSWSPDIRDTSAESYIISTNHTCSEVVRVGGQVYARGVMRHEPHGRRPDHVRISLGKQWHLILKNTVPVTR